VSGIRNGKRKRGQVRIGALDPGLTPNAGMTAISELCDRLGVIESVTQRWVRLSSALAGTGLGNCWSGSRRLSWPGRTSWSGWTGNAPMRRVSSSRRCRDCARPPPPGLARRLSDKQWRAVEAGVAAVTERLLRLRPAQRSAVLAEGPVTIDLDTTDVEVYGSSKRGVALTIRGNGWAARMWPPGPKPRSCWPPSWARVSTTPARAPRVCCAARWPPPHRPKGTRNVGLDRFGVAPGASAAMMV
jgi:hypothetical protein